MGNAKYPYRVYNFKVDIGVTRIGSFSECTGLDSSNDVIEYREGTFPQKRTQKMPGLAKYSNITLKFGVVDGDNKDVRSWILDTRNGKNYGSIRHDVTITLQDDAGTDKMEWLLKDAWCTKWTGAGLNAKGNEVVIESLELAHEGIEKWEPK